MLRASRFLGTKNVVKAFKTIRSFEVPELRLLAAELQHEKTGAKYWHLARDDANKTFGVQFRTTPKDDTGISHILEHTSLCGSAKYPCRDPFFKMLRRSQATFMNALTASDWTLYPFSTMNSTDFHNLLQVYLDAVFHPKLEELDFMQEGWRLQPKSLVDLSSPLTIKGIVFNEMKGVFSNSLNRFAQTVQNKLLPDTYGFVSGGRPDCIPSLTWGDLKKFHHDCYHPSNAVFYTYGDLELGPCLDYLDSEYLKHYDAVTLNNFVALEPQWDSSRSIDLTCEPDPMAPDPDRQCAVSLSYRFEDICNVYTNFILSLVSGLLLDGDNAPLYRGLIESGYGLDWVGDLTGMDKSIRTTSFHVSVQGVRVENMKDFPSLVKDILSQVIRDGFPKERVEAALHQYELALRHDSTRFGLNLILNLANFVNHNVDVEEILKIRSLLDKFRFDWESNPRLLEDHVQKYLLDNKHCLIGTLKPEKGWSKMEADKETQQLNQLVAKISPEEKAKLSSRALELEEKQRLTEDVSCLPCLDLCDISLETKREPFTLTQAKDCSVQLNEGPTNDLVYFHSLADLKNLPQDLLAYVPLFCELFTKLGADGLSYLEMDQAMQLHTGGLSASTLVTPILPSSLTNQSGQESSSASRFIHFSGYCLESKLANFFDLWLKLFRAPNWSDPGRLTTLVLMSVMGEWSANALSHSAHQFAMCRAAANLSQSRFTQELWNGIEQAKLVKKIAAKLGSDDPNIRDSTLDHLVRQMKSIWDYITSDSVLKFSLHGESEGLALGLSNLESFLSALPSKSFDHSTPNTQTNVLPQIARDTYLVMPYSVHYTAQAMPAPLYDSEEFPAYRVLSELMKSRFLHREIREKGGAYGGGVLTKQEALLFYSYRDPQCLETLDTFNRALTWAQTTEFTDQEINEAKLAVFQEVDSPVSAGSRGLNFFLHGIDDDLRQLHRSRLFAVNNQDLHSVADNLTQMLKTSNSKIGRAVLGPETTANQMIDQYHQENENKDSEWSRMVMVD